MRFSNVIMIYFITGAVMLGGGAISFEEAGVATWFVDDAGATFQAGANAALNINDIGGAITGVATLAIGSILLIWNLITGLLAFIHWPIITMLSVNAPPNLVLLVGGGLTAAFYLSLIRVVRVSA